MKTAYPPDILSGFLDRKLQGWFDHNEGVFLVFEGGEGVKIAPYKASDGSAVLSFEALQPTDLKRFTSQAHRALNTRQEQMASIKHILGVDETPDDEP